MYTGRHQSLKASTTASNGLHPPSRRLYAWKTNPAYEAEAQPTVISEDGSKTLRTRKYGNKSLPLPPIMDPIAIAGKQRHKQMKERVVKREDDLSEFEQKLRLNPFAHALATDIRQCRLTQALLPSHFLVPFAADIPAPDEQRKPSLVPALRSKVQGKSYIIGTREALENVSDKKSRWQVMLNEQVKACAVAAMGKQLTHKDWSWDVDTPEMVLQQLREKAVESLKGCLGRQEGEDLLVQLSGDGPVERNDLACILTSTGIAPARESTTVKSVPVYNLDTLLDPEQLEHFMQTSTRKGLVRHKRTVFTVTALEKLRNYVRGNEKDHFS
ncbi:hypothetical protein M409DRAFT_19943 [Zasmidium cellare ATCC 36951]|uniref:Uncharacterized protein n=1 Tax=Zasmidium cellare ATCC 36951 TaxID=1080233 RepID=A0A6A6CTP2_ZASCE|nr:uncharacterized protein M409DRAFT_19943 [Zasmidium cellare ATCC 36951]KAF2169530.1 hypothetical protein M409DRAFT_19943 [Zasmidium cellare ATCC 36951]